LIKTLKIQGVVVEHIDLGNELTGTAIGPDDYASGCPPYSIYSDKQSNDFAILRGLGRTEYVDTGFILLSGHWKVKVMAHYVSTLGLAFAEACGVQASFARSKQSPRRAPTMRPPSD
jgi:hypothetical protein